MRRSSAEPPFYSPPLGPTPEEDEGAHLERVASELSTANVALLERLQRQLKSEHPSMRREAAAGLGRMGSRESILVLREMLEGPDPAGWETAIYGLRQAREREGWLCLESVALEQVEALASNDPDQSGTAALRLLMMGRTKTMDRLFRAIDGHSRSIPAGAALRFAKSAVESLSGEQAAVMSLRLGISGRPPMTPQEVARATGVPEERVREIESEAWTKVQSPRAAEEFLRSA